MVLSFLSVCRSVRWLLCCRNNFWPRGASSLFKQIGSDQLERLVVVASTESIALPHLLPKVWAQRIWKEGFEYYEFKLGDTIQCEGSMGSCGWRVAQLVYNTMSLCLFCPLWCFMLWLVMMLFLAPGTSTLHMERVLKWCSMEPWCQAQCQSGPQSCFYRFGVQWVQCWTHTQVTTVSAGQTFGELALLQKWWTQHENILSFSCHFAHFAEARGRLMKSDFSGWMHMQLCAHPACDM